MTEQQHHHGQTAAAWTTVTILMVASVIGAIGIVSANYTLFWVALAPVSYTHLTLPTILRV